MPLFASGIKWHGVKLRLLHHSCLFTSCIWSILQDIDSLYAAGMDENEKYNEGHGCSDYHWALCLLPCTTMGKILPITTSLSTVCLLNCLIFSVLQRWQQMYPRAAVTEINEYSHHVGGDALLLGSLMRRESQCETAFTFSQRGACHEGRKAVREMLNVLIYSGSSAILCNQFTHLEKLLLEITSFFHRLGRHDLLRVSQKSAEVSFQHAKTVCKVVNLSLFAQLEAADLSGCSFLWEFAVLKLRRTGFSSVLPEDARRTFSPSASRLKRWTDLPWQKMDRRPKNKWEGCAHYPSAYTVYKVSTFHSLFTARLLVCIAIRAG